MNKKMKKDEKKKTENNLLSWREALVKSLINKIHWEKPREGIEKEWMIHNQASAEIFNETHEKW